MVGSQIDDDGIRLYIKIEVGSELIAARWLGLEF